MKKFLTNNGIYLLAVIAVFAFAFIRKGDQLSAKDFSQKMNNAAHAQVLDVRTPEEFREGYIKGAINIDWQGSDFNSKVTKLDKAKPVFIYCHSGRRSSSAASEMRAMGFKEVYELKDGIMGWQAFDLPVVR